MNSAWLRFGVAWMAWTAWTGAARAAPANDPFTSPVVVIGIPAAATGSNRDASLEPGEPLPEDWADFANASVWFRWTSPTSGAVQIDTFDSDFDTLLAVWTGNSLATLTLVAENDQFGGNQSAVFFHAESGTTYQVAVYGWLDDQGEIALHIGPDLSSSISGTVTGPDGTPPLEDIEATAYLPGEFGWNWIGSGLTDADGRYTIRGLVAGTYRVQFNDWNSGNYASEVYDDAPSLNLGTDIEVPDQTAVAGIDAALGVAAKISGTVTGPDGFSPLGDIEVIAWRWEESYWDWINSEYTGADGLYTIGGLAAGTYRVEFRDGNGNYVSQVYDQAPDLESGTNIVLAEGQEASGIDAALAAVDPPAIVNLRRTGINTFEILFTGPVGQAVILQETAALTAPDSWTNAFGGDGAPVECQSGTNVLPRESSWPAAFWRLRRAP